MVPLRLSQAKTRLSTQPAGQRRDLVVAMALDVLAAARECPGVSEVVLVADPLGVEAVAAARPPRLTVITDSGRGLNAALREGAAGTDGAVAALLADVPCVTSQILASALEAGADGPAFVCDAEGIGTTLLMATSPATFDPHFGVRSRAAHIAAGAREIGDPWPGALGALRRDVDSEVDLWDAQRIGLGAYSRAALGGG